MSAVGVIWAYFGCLYRCILWHLSLLGSTSPYTHCFQCRMLVWHIVLPFDSECHLYWWDHLVHIITHTPLYMEVLLGRVSPPAPQVGTYLTQWEGKYIHVIKVYLCLLQVQWTHILSRTRIKNIMEMSLTGVKERSKPVYSHVTISPMEIKTYRVSLFISSWGPVNSTVGVSFSWGPVNSPVGVSFSWGPVNSTVGLSFSWGPVNSTVGVSFVINSYTKHCITLNVGNRSTETYFCDW